MRRRRKQARSRDVIVPPSLFFPGEAHTPDTELDELEYDEGEYDESDTKKRPSYFRDLQLHIAINRIVNEVIPKSRDWDGRETQQQRGRIARELEHILCACNSDLEVADYRLATLDYLMHDTPAVKKVENIFAQLTAMDLMGTHRLHERMIEQDISYYVEMFSHFMHFVDNHEPFGDDAPLALKKLDEYILNLRGAKTYQRMREITRKFTGTITVDLRILCHPHLTAKRIIAAAINNLKPGDDEQRGEFHDKIDLTWGYEDREGHNVFQKALHRAMWLKYDRDFANAKGQLLGAASLFEELGVYLALTRYFHKLEDNGFPVCKPELFPAETQHTFVQGMKHPFLYSSGGEVVDNDVSYDKERHIMVLTGPNNGGKSVYVKSAALTQLLAQSGFYVPATSAIVSMRDNIYTHFVSPDDITGGEGRFKNELRRLKTIFETATPQSLVILDEPCGGTTAEAGEKHTRDFLEVFGQIGCPVYLATHMTRVAETLEQNPLSGVYNTHMSFSRDNGSLQPLFKLVRGPSPSDYGSFTVIAMGMEKDVLSDRVRRRLGVSS